MGREMKSVSETVKEISVHHVVLWLANFVSSLWNGGMKGVELGHGGDCFSAGFCTHICYLPKASFVQRRLSSLVIE